jgi:ABC-type oligopeptide transport system substrate-binding subunit
MKTTSILNSLRKSTTIQITEREDRRSYFDRATNESYEVTDKVWIAQRPDSRNYITIRDDRGTARVCAGVDGLEDDIQTDLFYSWYPKTIKSAISHVDSVR